MLARHRVPFAALLAQPHPKAAFLPVQVVNRHAKRRAIAGGAKDHEPDQSAVEQACDIARVDAVEQRAMSASF
jgi:hypothetical protein